MTIHHDAYGRTVVKEMGERAGIISARVSQAEKWVLGPTLGLFALATVFLAERYVVLHGLEDKVQRIGLGITSLPIPILLLPSIGAFALLAFSRRYVMQEIVSQRVRRRRSSQLNHLNLHSLGIALTMAAVFSASMLVPYLLGSVTFLKALGWICSLIPSIEPLALNLIRWISLFGALDELAKYSFSLVGASASVLCISVIMVRRASRGAPSGSR